MKCKAYDENRCHSCEYIAYDYEETIKIKKAEVESYFLMDDFFALAHPMGSRHKAKWAVSRNEAGRWAFGFYDKNQSFLTVPDCPLHAEGLNAYLPILAQYFDEFRIEPYDVKNKKGELKYLLATKSYLADVVMLRFVFRSRESLDRMKKFAQKLTAFYPSIKVISFNVQPEHKAILEGENEYLLTDQYFIEQELGDVKLELGVKSFFQVTPETALNLYQTVANYFKGKQIKRALDLYCGVGAFSFFLSKEVEAVDGLEISKEAIERARATCHKNGIGHLNFFAEDAITFLKNAEGQYGLIVVNPPRRGLQEDGCKSLLRLSPEFIAYSSCQAKTLFEDIEHLKESYQIVYSKFFDMFAFSCHYETLLILKKR